jgi:hypothetical protein
MCVPNCTLQVYWCCYTPHCKNTYLKCICKCTVYRSKEQFKRLSVGGDTNGIGNVLEKISSNQPEKKS